MLNTLDVWLKKIEKSAGRRKDFYDIFHVAKNLKLDKAGAKVITVTGTNGKGSCVEMLTSVYVDAGYSVGTYTSPHLFSFNERIRIQKNPIEDALLCEAFYHVEMAKENIELTYFEWVTLAALWLFKQLKVQVMILEVGIGGRLDATNIIDADLAIIASIGLDHTEFLGNTRESIATEKAGICRKDQWAVCGDPLPPETLDQVAQKMGTRMTYVGKDFGYEAQKDHWSFFSHYQEVAYSHLNLPHLAINNAAVVLQSILLMNDVVPVNVSRAIQSIIATTLAGRCEVRKLPNGATVILDVSHNPDAVLQLVNFIQPYATKKMIALFSMLHDKDIEAAIGIIKSYIKEWHVVELDHPRRASKEYLQRTFEHHSLCPQWYSDWHNAISWIKNQIKSEDVLVIFGSFFVVSAVIPLL